MGKTEMTPFPVLTISPKVVRLFSCTNLHDSREQSDLQSKSLPTSSYPKSYTVIQRRVLDRMSTLTIVIVLPPRKPLPRPRLLCLRDVPRNLFVKILYL